MNSALLDSFADEFEKVSINLSRAQLLAHNAKAVSRGWSAEREGLSMRRLLHSDPGEGRKAFIAKARESRGANTSVGRKPRAPAAMPNESGLDKTYVRPAPIAKPAPMKMKSPTMSTMKGFAAGAGAMGLAGGMMAAGHHPQQSQPMQ